ncbi:MAG: hypothetical protein K6U89_15990 [Chloroflexi bacterium]|nr:hypothetical protein [Chloroflexota bacterium]
MVNGLSQARSAREIWQTALGQLELQVNRTSFLTYLKDTAAGSFDGSCFTVVAPNTFARDWLEGRLASTVKRTLIEIVGRPVEVRFVVRAEEPVASAPTSPLESWAESQPSPRRSRLNPRGAYLIIAGDMTLSGAREVLERHLRGWEGSLPASAPDPQPPPARPTEILLVHRPGSSPPWPSSSSTPPPSARPSSSSRRRPRS